MRVTVRRLRHLGKILPASIGGEPPVHGELHVKAERDPELGRGVVRARVLDISKGTRTDVLPDLSDVQLLWAENGKLRLSGFERVEDASFAQTWAIEMQP